jgi:hypothetical protein
MKIYIGSVIFILVSFFIVFQSIASQRNFDGMYYCQDKASVSITNGSGSINPNIRFSVKVKQDNGYVEVIGHENFKGKYKISNLRDDLVYSKNYTDSNSFSIHHGVRISDNSDAYSFEAENQYIDIKTGVRHWNIAEGTCEKW